MLQGECAENRDYTLCLAKNSLQDKGSKWRSDVKFSQNLIQIHFPFIRKEGDMVCKALPSEISWELQLTSPACKSCPRHGSLYNTHRTNGAWSAHPGGETCTKPLQKGIVWLDLTYSQPEPGHQFAPLVSGKPKLAFQSEWLLKRDLVGWKMIKRVELTNGWNEMKRIYNHNAHLDLVQAAYLKQWYISHPAEYFLKHQYLVEPPCLRLAIVWFSSMPVLSPLVRGRWKFHETHWDSTSKFADWWECKPQFAKEVSKYYIYIYTNIYVYLIYMIIYQQFPLVWRQSPGKTSSAFPKLL